METDAKHDGQMVLTEEGLQINFSHAEDPAILIGIRGLIHLMSEIWRFLEKPTTKHQAQRAVLTIGLVKLCLDYIEEIQKCEEAYFAQSVLACSLVESLLMLVCIKERDRVTTSKRWRKFTQRQSKCGTRLHQLLSSIDLQTLIDIGDELGWFLIEAKQLEPFQNAEEWHLSEAYNEATPREVIGRLQHFRNGIHPGKALRANFSFDERSNKATLWLAFMSLAGVLVYAQDADVLRMTLPVHPIIRNLLEGQSNLQVGLQAGIFLGAAAAVLPGEAEEINHLVRVSIAK